MQIPAVQGLIDRRVLVNYRVDASVLAPLLPAPFRPKTVDGWAMVGICLIRLSEIRPRGLPAWLGISSENAAHRVAVDWTQAGSVRSGVYIRRRDSNSRLNTWVGGRLFPGLHNHARFDVEESDGRIRIALESDDRETRVSIAGRVDDRLPAASIFRSLGEASSFYQTGSLGYSATTDPARFQGLDLACETWEMTPLSLEEVRSSYFEDQALFPKGSIFYDCSLLMRKVPHVWRGRADLCAAC